jgi:lipoprotein-anchoring transpeptidase ErfK/SrfK
MRKEVMMNRKKKIFVWLWIVAWGVSLTFKSSGSSAEIIATDPDENARVEEADMKMQADSDPAEKKQVVIVDISDQELYLMEGNENKKTYPVSTSKYGTGNKWGSNKTPLGIHQILKKIGAGAKIGTIFMATINMDKIARIYEDYTDVEEDFVTTRIMWLKGMEEGVNLGEGIDSYDRRIYIHGTPEEGLIGRPASHGCIRMKNSDVVDLFDLVSEGTLVTIQE